MTAYSGHSGSMSINGAVVGEVKSFDVSVTTQIFNPNARGAAWQKNCVGNRAWSFAVTVNFDPGDAAQTLLLVGTPVDLVLYPAGDATGLFQLLGTAIITSWTIGSPEADVVSLSVQGAGMDDLVVE